MKTYNILYVFRKAVLKSIEKVKFKKFPHDFFYGFTLVNKNLKPFTTDKVFRRKLFLKAQYILNRVILQFVDIIGFSLIPSFFLIPETRKADLIFATADTYGLPLALFKKIKLFQGPLVFNTVGLYDAMRKRNNVVTKFYKSFLKSVDFFVAGGSYQECKRLSKLLNIPPSRFVFIPFGIDTEFFNINTVSERNEILVIGADPSRDWKLYKEVAHKLPNEKFRIITYKGVVTVKMPQNVIFEYNISPIKLREKIWKAKYILILSKKNYHFAGQSTILRSMSCAKAVVFTKTPGVEEYGFIDGENCKLVAIDDCDSIIAAISDLNISKKIRQRIGKNARHTITKLYTIQNYNQKLSKVFLNELKKQL